MSGILEKLHLKHPHPAAGTTGAAPLSTGAYPVGQQQLNPAYGGAYSGIAHPYQSAQSHPTYGYPRLTRDQKALRFEQKAQEWERRGNLQKAQKNREKALRHRQYSQPGYVAQQRQPQYYHEKYSRLQQREQYYQRNGNQAQALRTQQRLNRLRTKHTFLSQQQGGFVGGAQQHQTVVLPAVVQETVRTDRIVEVQPVIHREVDQSIVHHIEKHITEAPAANRGGVVQMAPIIQETIVRREIDEVQPVVHREVATTVVERVEEHQAQRVVAPTQHTNQVIFENSGARVGTQYTGLAIPYTGAAGPYGYPRLTRDQKALRFEQKAQEWERRGDLKKAQKNREKAQRHRQYSQPGFVAPQRPPTYYNDKYSRLQQRQNLYQQQGNQAQLQRTQQRLQRLQKKHNLKQ